MKVWHFSEMAYHPAWPELRDSYRVVVPNPVSYTHLTLPTTPYV